jgi:hypothetical protein
VLDDTGRPGCDVGTGAPCRDTCVGIPGATHCTHDCSSASDCPAGFACTQAGGRRLCVDIERPCATANQCPSGLGFCGAGGVGCTAECNTAADCPSYFAFFPSGYTCESRAGARVCVPHPAISGSAALGSICSSGNSCRSGACDDGASPWICNQQCSSRGGCTNGYACIPIPDGSDVLLGCNAAGSGWLNTPCARGSQCVTGMCRNDGAGYCTRLCGDGLCPTGMHCQSLGISSIDGTAIRMCLR